MPCCLHTDPQPSFTPSPCPNPPPSPSPSTLPQPTTLTLTLTLPQPTTLTLILTTTEFISRLLQLLRIHDFLALSARLQRLGRGMWSADTLLAVAYRQLPSNTASARRALAALSQMQQTAYDVSISLVDAVREVRMREGLDSAAATATPLPPTLPAAGGEVSIASPGATDLAAVGDNEAAANGDGHSLLTAPWPPPLLTANGDGHSRSDDDPRVAAASASAAPQAAADSTAAGVQIGVKRVWTTASALAPAASSPLATPTPRDSGPGAMRLQLTGRRAGSTYAPAAESRRDLVRRSQSVYATARMGRESSFGASSFGASSSAFDSARFSEASQRFSEASQRSSEGNEEDGEEEYGDDDDGDDERHHRGGGAGEIRRLASAPDVIRRVNPSVVRTVVFGPSPTSAGGAATTPAGPSVQVAAQHTPPTQ